MSRTSARPKTATPAGSTTASAAPVPSGVAAPPKPETATETARKPVTMDAVFTLRTPVDAQISPNGERVAFVLMEWVPDRPKQRGRIWLADAAGGDPRPLTDGADGDYAPRWSPDGTRIAFTSKRDEDGKGQTAKYNDKAQLYVMPAAGGAASRACSMPNGASEPAWSPDGSRIAFLSHEGQEPKDGPRVNEPLLHQRLWTVRPGSDEPEPVTPPDVTIWRYAWSPDSRQIAVYYSDGPSETDWYRGQIGVVPAGGGAVRRLTQLTRQADALSWSRDGQTLYYISGEWSDRGLVGGDIFALPAAGGEPRNLTPSIERNPSWVQELPDGKLLFAAWDGLANSLAVLDLANGQITTVIGDFVLGDWGWPRLSATPDGRRFAAVHTDASHPWDVWLGEWAGKGSTKLAWRPLTRLNPIVEETLRIAPSQRIAYTAPDGWRIEAFYTPPLEPKRGTPPPLVLHVHGGPSSAFRETCLEPLSQLLADAGFAVLRANPRGSQGRGVAFSDAVLGDMGGKDFQDLMAGVDYLVERGLADPKRLAIYGWSYGGFMTAWAVTQTTRFKAAVMGAGVCDFHSFHAQTNIADWDARFIGAWPNDNPDAYRQRSAITYVSRVVTPTLILHGEADPCVPVNQAYAFYRALREQGIATELAVYPREGHGPRERDHLRDLNERIVRWLERYL